MDNIASGQHNLDRSEGSMPRDPAAEGGSWEARLLRRVLRAMRDPPMEFLLEWSGERVAAHTHKPVARVRLADRSALWKLFSDPQVTLGDAYCAGRIEVDVELVQFLDLLFGDIHLLQAGGDLVEGQEPALLTRGDERTEFVELRNRSFVGQQHNSLLTHGPGAPRDSS